MSQTKLLEFTTDDGETIFFEIVDENQDEWRDAGAGEEAVIKASKTLNASLRSIKAIGKMIYDASRSLEPTKTEVEFGISFEVGSNVIVKAGAKSNVKIKFSWEKSQHGTV